VSTAGNECILLASSAVGIQAEPVTSAESTSWYVHFLAILPERTSLVRLVRY